jgi:hypothetical protein
MLLHHWQHIMLALKAKNTLTNKGHQQVGRASPEGLRKERLKKTTRREDKELLDHVRQQNRVARAAVRQISGNRREEQARDTAARGVQRQATPNRAQEQERARTKRKENKEKKLLSFYAKLQEAEARLGQDEEPSVQSTIHNKKSRRLAENEF